MKASSAAHHVASTASGTCSSSSGPCAGEGETGSSRGRAWCGCAHGAVGGRAGRHATPGAWRRCPGGVGAVQGCPAGAVAGGCCTYITASQPASPTFRMCRMARTATNSWAFRVREPSASVPRKMRCGGGAGGGRAALLSALPSVVGTPVQTRPRSTQRDAQSRRQRAAHLQRLVVRMVAQLQAGRRGRKGGNEGSQRCRGKHSLQCVSQAPATAAATAEQRRPGAAVTGASQQAAPHLGARAAQLLQGHFGVGAARQPGKHRARRGKPLVQRGEAQQQAVEGDLGAPRPR